jgi:hypothetical protein
MAPDFRYFFNLAPRGHFGHSLNGVFVFCLPAGLAVLWIFQTVMKLPLISLAPEPHQQRLVALAKPFRWGGAGRFTLIIASLLLGSMSHLAWDAFTHEHGLVVRNVPDFRAPLEEFGTHRPLYNLLQHGSSVLGLGLLAFWYWRWLKRTPAQPVPLYLQTSSRAKVWILSSILTVATGVSFFYSYFRSYRLASLSIFAGTLVATIMSVVFVAALGFSLWWHLSTKYEQIAISN